MASTSNLSTDITSLIVEYYEKKALAESEFKNGLLAHGKKGLIPEGNSDTIHWHRWSKFGLAQSLTQGADPASGQAANATEVKTQLAEFGDYIDIPLFGDAIRLDSLIKESYKKFMEQAQRTANRKILTAITNGSGSSYSPAKVLYANGKAAFANLTSGDAITNKDIQRAVAYIEQNQGPKPIRGFLDPWSKADLMIDDADFRSLLKQNDIEYLKKNNIPMWGGATLELQDEPWRETLGGTENTYVGTGQVVSMVIAAEESYGTAQLMGMNGLKPKFHVQNIQKTGATMSIGYRIPFAAAVLNATWLVVLKGVTRDSSVSSLA